MPVRAGTSVSATSSEAMRVYERVRIISVKISRVRPSTKAMGTNTQMVVSVEAAMAPPICAAPDTAARVSGSPRLRSR